MKRFFMFFVMMTSAFLSDGIASSLVTPEYAEIGGVARAMKMYQTLNQGRMPSSWDQIRQVYDLDKINQNLRYRQSYPLEDHYQFISQPMPFRSHGGVLSEGSQVLLMRTVPLENLSEPDESKRRQWRYLVVRSKDGEITSTRLPEQDVQAMLKSAGVTIRPKPGLPTVETDDVIPEREPKPHLSSNDVEFLKQHPELDPSKAEKRITKGYQSSALVTPEKVTPCEFILNWYLILGGLIIAAAIVLMVFRAAKK